MTLLSIESNAEWQCIHGQSQSTCSKLTKKGKKPFTFYKALKPLGNEFWTSGSNEGESCNKQNIYNWCSLNDTFLQSELTVQTGNQYFRNVAAANSETDRCLLFKLNGSTSDIVGLEHANCGNAKNYICEVIRGKK
jgi:hypothetical protein